MKNQGKALGNFNSPYIVSLLRLMETQSKRTIIKWCVRYTEEHILPIYESVYHEDIRPRIALNNAMGWLDGKVKYTDARMAISTAYTAVAEAEDNPMAQAAARTVNQAALTIHVPAHGLGLAFYGTVALAYARVGTNESHAMYEQIAAEECGKMEVALREISISHEVNPAKIDLRVWPHWQIKHV